MDDKKELFNKLDRLIATANMMRVNLPTDANEVGFTALEKVKNEIKEVVAELNDGPGQNVRVNYPKTKSWWYKLYDPK